MKLRVGVENRRNKRARAQIAYFVINSGTKSCDGNVSQLIVKSMLLKANREIKLLEAHKLRRNKLGHRQIGDKRAAA